MDTFFEELQTSKVVVYIGDIAVLFPTVDQHLINLNMVFHQLAKANIKVSFTKCVLG